MPGKSAVERFTTWVMGRVQQDAPHYIYAAIPKAQTDATYDDVPLMPYRGYFRIWLSEMFLTRSREWFIDWYPAVHCAVRLNFGGQDRLVSSVAQMPEQLAQGIKLNHQLTDLLPYNGGVVELQAALVALKGENHLKTTIKVLQDFSGLITAPLTQTLAIAEKVSSGLEELIGATGGNVHLPLGQTFLSADGGGATLKPGYHVAIRATQDQVAIDRLTVKGDQLYYAATPGAAASQFSKADYMLLRIEARTERDDYMLSGIADAVDKAVTATIESQAGRRRRLQEAGDRHRGDLARPRPLRPAPRRRRHPEGDRLVHRPPPRRGGHCQAQPQRHDEIPRHARPPGDCKGRLVIRGHPQALPMRHRGRMARNGAIVGGRFPTRREADYCSHLRATRIRPCAAGSTRCRPRPCRRHIA